MKSSEELAAQVRIIQLESELQSIQNESKKARYEQELELITNYPKSVNLQLELDELKQKYQTTKGNTAYGIYFKMKLSIDL